MAVLSLTERQKLLSSSRYSKSSSKRNTAPSQSQHKGNNKVAGNARTANAASAGKASMSLSEYKLEVAAAECAENNIHAQEVKRLDANPTLKGKMLEHYEQCLYFKWLLNNHPMVYEMAASMPNGSKRVGMDGYSLNAEGLKKGWPDVQLMYPTHNKFGLFIEFKRPACKYSCDSSAKAAPKEHQKCMLRNLISMGYSGSFAFGCEEAIKITEQYLLDGQLPSDLYLSNDKWL